MQQILNNSIHLFCFWFFRSTFLLITIIICAIIFILFLILFRFLALKIRINLSKLKCKHNKFFLFIRSLCTSISMDVRYSSFLYCIFPSHKGVVMRCNEHIFKNTLIEFTVIGWDVFLLSEPLNKKKHIRNKITRTQVSIAFTKLKFLI